ncbi:hypothetical protein DLAC_05493 [Tieghemostelium lacteum]|uniref:DNA-directed primase/polymerase protein n=1 Tax=Tieghemostelium lacteum TaxID=361077 RepID=A0A151ZFZ9_TIELA|nr:hypothetical protein DLAC_05493 [Tieghemostelium lacteum]|eukprot:KYQ92902.1 hypothetical protein DLAC_05493 [Tieghemostelium lacteum]
MQNYDFQTILQQINKQINEKKNLEDQEINKGKRVVAFAKQQEAFDYDQKSGLLYNKFFSKEIGKDGKREFYVGYYEDFWDLMIKSRDFERNYYELIKEGSNCHLYLDIEYQRDVNKELLNNDHDELIVDLLIQRLCEEFKYVFGLDVTRKNFLDLDSSSNVKFSRHLICKITGYCWPNNEIMGMFINDFIDKLTLEKPVNSQVAQLLFVMNASNQVVSIIDKGVYTKNRNFRLYLSSKYGKIQPLILSKTNQYPFNSDSPTEKEIFYHSLICNIDDFNSTFKTLVYPPPIPLDKILDKSSSPTKRFTNNNNSSSPYKKLPSSTSSPYPDIDAYIKTELINRGGVSGWIKSITTDASFINYQIGGNKYCENIKRQHKSNHIYFIVNLSKKTLVQRCFDPDCKNFISNPIDIQSYLPSSELKPLDIDFDNYEFDDEIK